jgi:SAM-dependent methyltransferase
MPHRVCPWWLGYLLASPLRRLYQDPRAILSPPSAVRHDRRRDRAGMGFFTLDIARLVGPGGRVVAIDVQPKMLDALKRRAKRAGLPDRVETRPVAGEATGMEDLDGQADFVLAFAVVHELPDMHRFFAAAGAALKPGGRTLLAEPSGHVTAENFAKTLAAAAAAGLRRVDSPRIRGSRTALLEKGAGQA